FSFFFFHTPATPPLYTLSLHDALPIWILPWAVGSREHFEDPHAHDALPEGVAVDSVAIAEEVGWRGVVRERLHDLLGGPGRGGIDRKSTRLNSSHDQISYAVFCLKKKK